MFYIPQKYGHLNVKPEWRSEEKTRSQTPLLIVSHPTFLLVLLCVVRRVCLAPYDVQNYILQSVHSQIFKAQSSK